MAGASLEDLLDLQSLLVGGLKQRLEQDQKDDLPTDAATLGVITKLLKDNNVMVSPADKDDLVKLREKFVEKSKNRKLKSSNVIDLCNDDLSTGTYGD